MQVVTAPQVLLDGRLRRPGWVSFRGGVVHAAGEGAPPSPPTCELTEGVLAPGLIDLQVNGAFGHDVAEVDEAGWHELSRRLTETGVTGYVPTIVTAPLDELIGSLGRYRRVRSAFDRAGGARTLGMHVEAAFLAPERRGAHREDLLLAPLPQHLEPLLAAGGQDLAYVTLAPELPGGLDAVRRLVAAGVRVAIGHSDATEDQARAAVDAGASLVTHLYNAQRGLHHRDGGVVGIALSDERLTAGLIADGQHVGAAAIRVAFAAAGPRIALVTDAIAAMGMPGGTYDLGGEPVNVVTGGAPVRADGTLAGSVLRLDTAIANVIGLGVDPALALTAATTTPAEALGRRDIGRIAAGASADLVWLDDRWRARATWLAGRLVHGEGAVLGLADGATRRREEGRS